MKHILLKTQFTLLLLLLLLTSACGFQLRQAYHFSPGMQAITLKSQNINTAFINQLESSLQNNGIKLVSDSDTVLSILSYQQQKNAASTNAANARQTETRLSHRLDYSLTHNGELLIAPQSITRSKEYINDNSNLSGKIEEERLLRKTLDRELVELLLRRLTYADEELRQNTDLTEQP